MVLILIENCEVKGMWVKGVW